MVSAKKKELVQNLIKQIQSYPIVGLVNMENLPAQQLQNMRAMLREKGVQIVMTRKKLIQLALKDSKLEGIDNLTEKIIGMPALILSKDNPFTLYNTLQKNKSPAPAKAGQTAPNDIIVKGGPTSFAPGPIISELGAVGIKTKVDGGKLTIISDIVVAKEGDVITPALAEMLKRLDIQPMEVGLNLVAVWENGTIFAAKQLHVDEEEYMQNFIQAAQWAMNLAIETAYPTADTMGLLLQKASREAKAVALDQNIVNDDTKEEILAKAEAQAVSVKDAGSIEVGAAPVKKAEEPKTEEKPVEEEKKEEPVVEPTVEESKAEEPVEEAKAEEPVEEAKAEEPVEEAKAKEPVEEAKAKEPVAEPVVEESKAEEPVEEAKAEEPVAEPVVEEAKVEEPVAEESTPEMKSEEDILEAMKNIPDEKIELDVPTSEKQSQSGFHPKQGDVSTDQAQELLEKLQKEGTLRDTEEK